VRARRRGGGRTGPTYRRGRLQTPRSIIDNVQRDIVKLHSDPLIVDKMIKAGISGAISTPEELGAFIRKELKRWRRVSEDSGIQLN
jgi:tripartite-type tricarboxylate transporter receptor subunit TctC